MNMSDPSKKLIAQYEGKRPWDENSEEESTRNYIETAGAIAEQMQGQLREKFASLHKKFATFGAHGWRPGLTFEAIREARTKSMDDPVHPISVEQAKLELLNVEIDGLREEVLEMLHPAGGDIMVVEGNWYETFGSVIDKMAANVPDNANLRERILNLRGLLSAYDENIKNLKAKIDVLRSRGLTESAATPDIIDITIGKLTLTEALRNGIADVVNDYAQNLAV